MKKLGKRSGCRQAGQTVYLEFEEGKARVEIVSPEIVRVFCGA